MIKKLHVLNQEYIEELTAHLENNKDRLEADASSYARGRSKYWIQHGWNLIGGKVVDLTQSTRPEAIEEFSAGTPPQAALKERSAAEAMESLIQ